MFNPYFSLFGRHWYLFTLLFLATGSLTSLYLLWTAPQGKRAAYFDVYLAGVIGAVLVGRVVHVTFTWDYFAYHLNEILRLDLQGGLTWQAAFIGGLFASLAMARIRQIEPRLLFQAGMWLFPLLALLSWWGCAASACAYGAVVARMSDYPAWLTWSANDTYGLFEPRFAVQPLGMVWSAILLGLALLLLKIQYSEKSIFWLMLLLYALGDFCLHVLRADDSLWFYGLRFGQVFDVVLILVALQGCFFNRSASVPASP